jgi:hypothetical protein
VNTNTSTHEFNSRPFEKKYPVHVDERYERNLVLACTANCSKRSANWVGRANLGQLSNRAHIYWYGAQWARQLRPMCIGTVRSRTQSHQSIKLGQLVSRIRALLEWVTTVNQFHRIIYTTSCHHWWHCNQPSEPVSFPSLLLPLCSQRKAMHPYGFPEAFYSADFTNHFTQSCLLWRKLEIWWCAASCWWWHNLATWELHHFVYCNAKCYSISNTFRFKTLLLFMFAYVVTWLNIAAENKL